MNTPSTDSTAFPNEAQIEDALQYPGAVVRLGDCLEVLRAMPDNSVDSIVTDPTYGLSNVKPERITEAITAWASGSGTTIEAAILEGFDVVGVEMEPSYLPLIERRLERATIGSSAPTGEVVH